MTITNKRSLIALLMSLVLVVSLFTIGISADETTTAAAETSAASENATSENTTKAEETTTGATTTTAATETGLTDAQKSLQKTLIINAIIVGVIIAILVIVGIKFRTKLGDFFRSVKSERKKIVWSSKENTKKSFWVVVVVAIAIALLLFIVDFAFKTGLGMLHGLVK